jgi:hypothetical protein
VTNWYPVAASVSQLDVQYTRIETAMDGQTLSLSKTQGLRPTGVYTAKDQGILAVVFRAQRSFRDSRLDVAHSTRDVSSSAPADPFRRAFLFY